MPETLEAILNGTDLFGEPIKRRSLGPVADKFGFPPFSVLDARQGEWQDRKRAWIDVGIKGEVGRGGDLAYKGDIGVRLNVLTLAEGRSKAFKEEGTSVFDPTLCECAYRWFCPPGGQVVDPFAGGSVRGIIAAREISEDLKLACSYLPNVSLYEYELEVRVHKIEGN